MARQQRFVKVRPFNIKELYNCSQSLATLIDRVEDFEALLEPIGSIYQFDGIRRPPLLRPQASLVDCVL